MAVVTTIEEAYDFVLKVGVCTVFSGKVPGVQSFWDVVDLPERSGGRTQWGARIEAVWEWKVELPTLYPDDIFYGKVKGGIAALMSMRYLREIHYPQTVRPVSSCKPLAQQVFEIIRLSPGTTAEVRREAIERFGCSKGRFDTALKELQVSLNIVRLNEPGLRNDTWIPFGEVYGDFDLAGEDAADV